MNAASCGGQRPLIVANWKLHGDGSFTAELLSDLNRRLADAAGVDIVVCPPCVYLSQASDLLRGTDIMLGAQDVSDREQGAYTGESSARMLKDVGCDYVIVGHSERRRLYNEDDEQIARKFAAALAAGLTPILCVGETLEQRDAGEAAQVVAAQLAVADGVPDGARWVIAYEPVWAIGTGRTAAVEQVIEMHAEIRERLEAVHGAACPVRVVYGGSVNPDNALVLFQADGVDGGLIGGASLDGESFYRICTAARDSGN